MRRPFSLPPRTAPLVNWLILRAALLRSSVIFGVRTIVLQDEQVFLVRHSYLPGWHFPGGGVEIGETARTAAAREVREEAGLATGADLTLFGLYLNVALGRRNHVAVYVTRAATPLAEPGHDWEIVERGFFPVSALPDGTTPATRARLDEVLHGVPPSETW